MTLDRRLNAYRDDLADARLKDRVSAARYVSGEAARITVPVAPVLCRPEAEAPLDTEFLFGEPVTLFDQADGYAFVQSRVDGYVGYVSADAVGADDPAPTHRVTVPLALVYTAPSIKVPVAMRLPLGAALTLGPAETVGGERMHALHGGGSILAQHVGAASEVEADFVAVAARFIGTPYLFGGKSWLGIDCSALIQVALNATGRDSLRDSDMQAAHLGERLADDTRDFQRGDLIFWKGHVGVMMDGDTLLHANGYHMCTATEPVADALSRLNGLGLPPIAIRRIAA